MQTAWRERDQGARIKAAKEALEKNPECPTALILLAEEEQSSMIEVEKYLKQALKIAEQNYRKSQQLSQNSSSLTESCHRRDTNVLIYIRRRLAMVTRKLGKLKESTKMMRDLMKEFPMMNVFNIHENLIESLLEMQAYADVQAVLAKYDGMFKFFDTLIPIQSISLLLIESIENIYITFQLINRPCYHSQLGESLINKRIYLNENLWG